MPIVAKRRPSNGSSDRDGSRGSIREITASKRCDSFKGLETQALQRPSVAFGWKDCDSRPSEEMSFGSRASSRMSARVPVHRKPLTPKQRLFHTLEDPGYSFLAKCISIFMIILILASTIAFVMESEVCTDDPCTLGFIAFEPCELLKV